MADPITMIAIGATVAGAATTAYGQSDSGKAQKSMYDYQAQVARQNAQYERQVGERRAAELGLRQRDEAARLVSAQAASGIDINRGTPVDVRRSQREIFGIEQQDVRAG